ncbi:hypothetical protein GCM10009753_68080 [Streptantibioticus ferralitis]
MCLPTGMPILWALANPKLDEHEVLMALLDREPEGGTYRPGLLLTTDKGLPPRSSRPIWPCAGRRYYGHRSSDD